MPTLKESVQTLVTVLFYFVSADLSLFCFDKGFDLSSQFSVSFVTLIFLHDSYFYWSHRLLHHRFFYKRFHLHHHLHTNPTTWSAFEMHPIELLIEILFFPLVFFFFKFNNNGVSLFIILMIGFNFLGHMQKARKISFYKNWPLLKYIQIPENHFRHHQYSGVNFGAYFTIWDQICGTFFQKGKILSTSRKPWIEEIK